MNNSFGNNISFTAHKPWLFTSFVYHGIQSLLNNGIETIPSNTGSLNIRYVFETVQFFGWTPLKQHNASPLTSYFFLNVKNKPIHPALSSFCHTALNQGTLVYIFVAEHLNICPLGNTGRVNSYTLVERLRLSDSACKARFYIPRGIENLFNAWALKALHGSLVFRWGEKPLRIFELLSHLKNQTAHISLGLISSLVPPRGVTFVQKPSRLNTLRVTEHNIAGGAS